MIVLCIFSQVEKWGIIINNVFPNVNAIVVEGNVDITLRNENKVFLLRKIITFQNGKYCSKSFIGLQFKV
jgi:hypothetical protein